MPAVFVHGVPDTAVVWRALRQRLKRTDVICVSLPGFGNQRPPGFKPDKDSYARWLVSELRTITEPIDLVGHDWGSLLVTRAVSIAPDIVRSWSGGGAPLDLEYVWHDTAQVWQTPGKGEELMKVFTGEVLARGLAAQGIPLEMARETSSRVDDEMKSCILGLYRSAIRVADDWFTDLKKVVAPSLILWGEHDPYAGVQFAQRLAANVNGRCTTLRGVGHWYQVEAPELVAEALESFWAAL